MIFNILNGMTPVYLGGIFSRNIGSTTCNLRMSRYDWALRLARTTTQATGKSLPTLEPKSGNTSPEDEKCETSIGAFKTN